MGEVPLHDDVCVSRAEVLLYSKGTEAASLCIMPVGILALTAPNEARL